MRSKAAIQASKAAFAEARPNYVGPDGRCVRAGNGTVNNAERPAYFVWAPAPATAPPPPTPEWPSAQPPRSVGKKRPPPAAVDLEDLVAKLKPQHPQPEKHTQTTLFHLLWRLPASVFCGGRSPRTWNQTRAMLLRVAATCGGSAQRGRYCCP